MNFPKHYQKLALTCMQMTLVFSTNIRMLNWHYNVWYCRRNLLYQFLQKHRINFKETYWIALWKTFLSPLRTTLFRQLTDCFFFFFFASPSFPKSGTYVIHQRHFSEIQIILKSSKIYLNHVTCPVIFTDIGIIHSRSFWCLYC